MSDFEIGGVGYDWPTSYHFGDTVLIQLAASLDFVQFAEMVEALSGDDEDAVAELRRDARLIIAQMAVAVQRRHPRWSAQRVADFVKGLDIDGVEFTAPEPEPAAEEAAADVPPADAPPAQADSAADGAASPESAETSSPEPPSDSDETTPSLSGALS